MGSKLVEMLSAMAASSKEATSDILVIDFAVVTACLVGSTESTIGDWVLIDAGLENSADYILHSAEKRFGRHSRPAAIILTHGHFDHVGSIIKLLEVWDVPVYIHQLELPYVTGQKDYPKGDPSVDEGIVAKMSPTFPHTSINISSHVSALPDDGSIPGMPDWKWIHTPGHTDGHVSLFREKDRILIVGDAFSTTKQESLLSVIMHRDKISGPPKYLTTDWQAAESSVRRLKELNPSLVIPSHGKPMGGEELAKHLEMLTAHFNEIAKPKQGRFVTKP